MACLATVNGLVFNDNIKLIFDTSKKEPENFIQYTPEKKGRHRENYLINVGYFGKTIKKQLEEGRRIFLDENGNLIKNGEEAPLVSFEELLFGIAIHEVRHRIQEKRNIKLIGQGDKVFFDGNYINDEFIDLQSSFVDSLRKRFKKEGGLEEGLPERKTGNGELDAIIIEKMAVSRLHHRKTNLEQLKQIVITEPEK